MGEYNRLVLSTIHSPVRGRRPGQTFQTIARIVTDLAWEPDVNGHPIIPNQSHLYLPCDHVHNMLVKFQHLFLGLGRIELSEDQLTSYLLQIWECETCGRKAARSHLGVFDEAGVKYKGIWDYHVQHGSVTHSERYKLMRA